MARARSANGRQQTAKTSCTLRSGTKRKPGRPRKNWIDTIQQDLKSIGMTWEVARFFVPGTAYFINYWVMNFWEVAQQLAVDREGWRRRVAQCVCDTG